MISRSFDYIQRKASWNFRVNKRRELTASQSICIHNEVLLISFPGWCISGKSHLLARFWGRDLVLEACQRVCRLKLNNYFIVAFFFLSGHHSYLFYFVLFYFKLYVSLIELFFNLIIISLLNYSVNKTV